MDVSYVGLDVASRTCHWQAMDREGKVRMDRKFETTEAHVIQAAQETPEEAIVCLEASELAGWIREVLRGRVSRVIVIDPKAAAWISKDARKHDRMDAGKLADLNRMGLAQRYEVYYPDRQDRSTFKQIVQQYDQLTREQAQLKQRIKAAFRRHGVILRGKAVYEAARRQKVLAQVKDAAMREAVEHLYELLDQMVLGQQKSRRLMQREAKRYEEIARLDEVPGVGIIGACRFSAYIQTPHRFGSKRKLWRYCRLGIRNQTSDGKPLGRQALDWNGNGTLKDMSRKAFEGAQKTRADNMFKRAFRRSLAHTHNQEHARLSTQRKMLSVLRAIWRDGSRYQDDKG